MEPFKTRLPPTRTVWVRKWPRNGLHTQHELDCRFMARRQRNEPNIIAEQYDEVRANQVTVPIYECSHCSPKVNP